MADREKLGDMARGSPLPSKPIGVGVGSQPQRLTKKKKKKKSAEPVALRGRRIGDRVGSTRTHAGRVGPTLTRWRPGQTDPGPAGTGQVDPDPVGPGRV
ncbi:hypothetical protein Syun_029502 [Stephania yunnanensis]|uniref:Uncharacterized protein n=1 Tax=Stephania yunnanensis TaxID=152371 RepID=A0AAP0E8Q3_9MAGN